jgi:hypothetical protein
MIYGAEGCAHGLCRPPCAACPLSVEYPHHTAIVSEVRDGGRVVAIFHQNVGAHAAADATKQVVQEASIRPESLQAGGAVAIFRPDARDEGEIRRKIP